MRKIHTILYAFFVYSISEVCAEREIIDDVNYNSLVRESDSHPNDYQGLFPKRAALLLDRIMVALQHALEDEDNSSDKNWRPSVPVSQDFVDYPSGPIADDLSIIKEIQGPQSRIAPRNYDDLDYRRPPNKTMGLQRRGHGSTDHPKGRVWRCYFNAVTCFRKK